MVARGSDKLTPCIGCGSLVPNIDGPTHKYLEASPGCWKLFGDILAKEYGDPAYMKVHRLTVDAYALQHLGAEEPRTIQSMNLHLLALCAALEHGIDYGLIPKIMNKVKGNNVFTWLTPPPSLGGTTVVTITPAQSADEHSALVLGWANDVWQQWHIHHDLIEGYYASGMHANTGQNKA